MDSETFNGINSKIWIGVAIGAAVGVGIALSRTRRKTRWDAARSVTRRISDSSGDMAETAKEIMARMKTIYEESRAVVEQAGDLWQHSRKLVGV